MTGSASDGASAATVAGGEPLPEHRLEEDAEALLGLEATEDRIEPEQHPVLRLLSDPDEAPVLFRTIPPAELAARTADDDRWFGALFARWRSEGVLRDVDPEVLAAWPRMALAVAQQRERVGNRYPELGELVADALARRLAP